MIEPQDEHPHEIGPEPSWSESYYFNFHDASSGLAGFTRIGFRPNEGVTESSLFLFLPGGGAVAVVGRERRTDNPATVSSAGITYEMVGELDRWRIRSQAKGLAFTDAAHVDLASGTQGTAGGTRGAAQGKVVSVVTDVDFIAAMPPFGTSGRRRRGEDAAVSAASVAAGHFEQAGEVSGIIAVDGTKVRVSGLGVRDKSWGPRDWSAPWGWRWFSMPFGPDLAVGVHAVMLPGREVQAGWVWRDGRTFKVVGFELQTTYEGRFHRSLEIRATDQEDRGYRIEGSVGSVIPLRIGATRVNEGLTEFTLHGRRAIGIAEYLDNH
jgi:hypothetical protein